MQRERARESLTDDVQARGRGRLYSSVAPDPPHEQFGRCRAMLQWDRYNAAGSALRRLEDGDRAGAENLTAAAI